MAERRVEPGVRLSGHLLSEEIGQGGFSRVFRATPANGGPDVAIKVAIGSELVSALRSEGAVLRRLRSPYFVEIKEEHLDEDPPYFVLELCPGGDLRALLERSAGKRLAPEVAEKHLTAILEGMAFAHDEGFVHGDLKPENVLLGPEGTPKIADLGLSRAHRQKLQGVGKALADSLGTKDDGKLRGTFDYIAPEVRAGQEISPASDVYALGVLFYELLTGKRPLGVFDLPRALLAREGVAVPAHLDRVVGRALAHDTSERYPDASLMLADLRAGEVGITLTAAADGASRGPRQRLVGPVNDLLFMGLLYGGMLLPAGIFLGACALSFAIEPGPLLRGTIALAPLALTAALASWFAPVGERRRVP
jgi:serine/threonine protein kinase